MKDLISMFQPTVFSRSLKGYILNSPFLRRLCSLTLFSLPRIFNPKVYKGGRLILTLGLMSLISLMSIGCGGKHHLTAAKEGVFLELPKEHWVAGGTFPSVNPSSKRTSQLIPLESQIHRWLRSRFKHLQKEMGPPPTTEFPFEKAVFKAFQKGGESFKKGGSFFDPFGFSFPLQSSFAMLDFDTFMFRLELKSPSKAKQALTEFNQDFQTFLAEALDRFPKKRSLKLMKVSLETRPHQQGELLLLTIQEGKRAWFVLGVVQNTLLGGLVVRKKDRKKRLALVLNDLPQNQSKEMMNPSAIFSKLTQDLGYTGDFLARVDLPNIIENYLTYLPRKADFPKKKGFKGFGIANRLFPTYEECATPIRSLGTLIPMIALGTPYLGKSEDQTLSNAYEIHAPLQGGFYQAFLKSQILSQSGEHPFSDSTLFDLGMRFDLSQYKRPDFNWGLSKKDKVPEKCLRGLPFFVRYALTKEPKDFPFLKQFSGFRWLASFVDLESEKSAPPRKLLPRNLLEHIGLMVSLFHPNLTQELEQIKGFPLLKMVSPLLKNIPLNQMQEIPIPPSLRQTQVKSVYAYKTPTGLALNTHKQPQALKKMLSEGKEDALFWAGLSPSLILKGIKRSTLSQWIFATSSAPFMKILHWVSFSLHLSHGGLSMRLVVSEKEDAQEVEGEQ